MAGRPRLFDEQEIIKKAAEVFWTKGYEASSAEELLQAMDIGKGSFYLLFKGGKRELYQKSLELLSSESLNKLTIDIENSEDQMAFLKNKFLSLADASLERKKKGCYLGNAIVEMSNMDKETHQKAVKLLAKLEKAFEKIIETAQKEKKIRSKEKPTVLAKYLINLWNGINLTRRMNPDTESLKAVIHLQFKIVE